MTSHTNELPRLISRLSLATEPVAPPGGELDERRIRLLEAIDRLGSIARAARAVPMSYRGAREALDALGALTAGPLVQSTVGGREGGGTRLTASARRLVALYRAVQHEYQDALDHRSAHLRQSADADEAALRGQLRRLALRTSARNRFAGTLVALSTDRVGAQATVRLPARCSRPRR